MNFARSVADAITLLRPPRSPASSGTAFVCASPTLTLAIFLCVACSTCTTVGPPLVSTPPEAANRVTGFVRARSVAFCVAGTRTVPTFTPTNRVAGTKMYDERETVSRGGEPCHGLRTGEECGVLRCRHAHRPHVHADEPRRGHEDVRRARDRHRRPDVPGY